MGMSITEWCLQDRSSLHSKSAANSIIHDSAPYKQVKTTLVKGPITMHVHASDSDYRNDVFVRS